MDGSILLEKTLMLYSHVSRLCGYGVDPYQVREIIDRALRSARFSPVRGVLRRIYDYVMLLNLLDPFMSRRFNPMAAGLVLQAVSRLAYIGAAPRGWRRCLERLVDELDRYRARGYRGTGWGSPFHWYTHRYIPAWTPAATTTAIVGHGLLDAYMAAGLEKALELYMGVPLFYARDLKRFRGETGVCLSYTPIDDMLVHNANLMAAEHLLIGYMATGDEEYRGLALEAVKHTVSEIMGDGSLCYYSSMDRRRHACRQDFHTAFESHSLGFIWLVLESLGDDAGRVVGEAFMRRTRFLLEKQLAPGAMGLYVYRDGRRAGLSVDSRSLSAAAIAASFAAWRMGRGVSEKAAAALLQMTRMLWSRGRRAYMYRLSRRGRLLFRDRTVYVRMSIAWPLRALSELLLLYSGRLPSFYRAKISVSTGASRKPSPKHSI